MRRLAAVALFCVGATGLQAQGALDRRVTLPGAQFALGAALDTLAARADIRLSYSTDAVPTLRPVTMRGGETTVRRALESLLTDLPVALRSVGSDHVVIMPDKTRRVGAMLLERVEVTETRADPPPGAPTIAATTITGAELERRHVTSLTQALSGTVPGVWMWDHGPSALTTHFGSLRGSSSFGVSLPKVYVDGIEVANPMFFGHIAPSTIDRIEVIRGPHGAAVYGADAISGVVNIVSRSGYSGTHSVIQSDLGVMQSEFGSMAPTMRHALSVRGGHTTRSGGFALRGASSGNYLPNAYARELHATGDYRVVDGPTSVVFMGRVGGKEAGLPWNPLLPGQRPPVFETDQGKQGLGMYSFGSTLRRTGTDGALYSVTAGVDGYRLGYVQLESTPFPTSSDTALRSASGGADRLMIRASSERSVELPGAASARLTFGAEHALLRDHSLAEGDASVDSIAVLLRRVDWTTNSGVLARSDLSFGKTLFLTAASRLERIQTERRPRMLVLLPQVGIAARQAVAGVEATARASYGRAVRSPSAGARAALWSPISLVSRTPESQVGLEGGIDLNFGRRAALHLTHYHQVATGLQQGIEGAPPCTSLCGDEPAPRWMGTVVPEGGAIRNTGWEAEGTVTVHQLTLSAVSSLTESRVLRLAGNYTGELRVGDRVLGVPRRTTSAMAEWNASRWSTAWSLTRASDWINYDRLRMAMLVDVAGTPNIVDVLDMRDFWTNYTGASRLRGTIQLHLPEGLSLLLTGENLTNAQRGEPDSMTILPGRSFTLGLKARF